MIHVVDYGTGNVGSVLNMIRKVGGEARASGDAVELSRATKLLLPGVGSFDNAVQKLTKLGLPDLLRDKVREGVPLLGICLGMQLLSDGSEEGVLPGLGLIPGLVRHFSFGPECADLKIPHMGWNRIRRRKAHRLLDGLDENSRFYFVHSYHYQCQDEADVLLETSYGYDFTSGVQRENVIGVQFHPEKSHRYGMQLMKNFVGI